MLFQMRAQGLDGHAVDPGARERLAHRVDDPLLRVRVDAGPVVADLDPGADRIPVGAVLMQRQLQPMAKRLSLDARTRIAPDFGAVIAVDHHDIHLPVTVQIDHRRAPCLLEAGNPRLVACLGKGAVGLAQHLAQGA